MHRHQPISEMRDCDWRRRLSNECEGVDVREKTNDVDFNRTLAALTMSSGRFRRRASDRASESWRRHTKHDPNLHTICASHPASQPASAHWILRVNHLLPPGGLFLWSIYDCAEICLQFLRANSLCDFICPWCDRNYNRAHNHLRSHSTPCQCRTEKLDRNCVWVAVLLRVLLKLRLLTVKLSALFGR